MNLDIDFELCRKFHFGFNSDSETDSDNDEENKNYEIYLRNKPPPIQIPEIYQQLHHQKTEFPISSIEKHSANNANISESTKHLFNTRSKNNKSTNANEISKEKRQVQNKVTDTTTNKSKTKQKYSVNTIEKQTETSLNFNRFSVLQNEEISDEDNTTYEVKEIEIISNNDTKPIKSNKQSSKLKQRKNKKKNNQNPPKIESNAVVKEVRQTKQTKTTTINTSTINTSRIKTSRINTEHVNMPIYEEFWPEMNECLGVLLVCSKKPFIYRGVVKEIMKEYELKAILHEITIHNFLKIITQLVNASFVFLRQQMVFQSFDMLKKVPNLNNLKTYIDKSIGIVKFSAPVRYTGNYFKNFPEKRKINCILNLTQHRTLNDKQIDAVVCASIVDMANVISSSVFIR